jgi:hypothetical protein
LHRTVNNSAETARGAGTSVSLLVLLLIAVLISGPLQPACAQPPAEEYKVKAAFIFHFAQLVDWPGDVLNAADPTLSLCVFDDEPRLHELQSTLEGKLVGTRVLHVHLLSQSLGLQGCNILFLSRDEGRRQAAVLKSLRGQPVLTVGETDSFLADGGMIRLHLEDDRIRFDIDASSADSSHLKISSRLLLLATTVTLGGEKDRRR